MAVGLAITILVPGPLRAQRHTAATRPDSVRHEIAALRAQVDSLRAVLRRMERADSTRSASPSDEALARLRAAALAAASGEEASRPDEPQESGFVGRQRALQALNPELTVGGDLLGIWREGDPTRDNVQLREIEFVLQATLDPFSRAKVIVSHHAQGTELEPFPALAAGAHEHDGFDIEEAYAQWVNLPAGLGLTVGRFRQKLGTYNRWHRHALPWESMPLAYGVLLGHEGLAQTGASVHWLAPPAGFGTYEVWLEATRSGNTTLFGDATTPSVLGHANAFYELSPSTWLELGVTGVTGGFETESGEATRRLLHLEAGLNWRPPGRELYREVTVRGALLRSTGPGPVAADGSFSDRTVHGGFLFTETRLNRRWLAGLRYDRIGDPAGDADAAWMLAPTLTWWQSEFVRARGEYDWLHTASGSRGQLLVQLTFAMGPHKHETY
ncbi:MAG: hypothetical protein PVH00_10335 [Gemmatimonadota bacterium]|jgi:hypothetical protein